MKAICKSEKLTKFYSHFVFIESEMTNVESIHKCISVLYSSKSFIIYRAHYTMNQSSCPTGEMHENIISISGCIPLKFPSKPFYL